MKNKKISELMEEYKSVSNPSDKYKLRKAPAERLEEIAKFVNKFDNFMSSQGYMKKIVTNFSYDGDNNFWFQYLYSKEPITDSVKIGIFYRLIDDDFFIIAYNTKNMVNINLFKFLEKNYTIKNKERMKLE